MGRRAAVSGERNLLCSRRKHRVVNPGRRAKRLEGTLAGVEKSVGVFAVLMFIPVGVQPDNSILLPSGQTITPAGTQLEVNDRPMGIAMR